MRQRLFLILLFSFLLPGQAWSFEVLVLQSGEAPPYARAAQAFSDLLLPALPNQGVKSIANNSLCTYTIAKGEKRAAVARLIDEQLPDLVVAIGKKALQAAVSSKRPVVYLLVPQAQALLPAGHQATGVLLENSLGREFAEIRRLLPHLKRVGVVYDPERCESLVSQAVAAQSELTFIRRPITSGKEVVGQLEGLKGEIDLLWMVPDLTAVSPQTEQSYYRFSLQEQIPLFSFSEIHLAHGATLATTFDWQEMGKQAAILALDVLSGTAPQDIPPLQPEKVRIRVNVKIAEKINLQFAVPVK
ncbi:MAG: hypothetical protein KJ804_21110 [Proteobacteria bacterium]|nr:hypothetical protein [Pseudomonadota bacterium]MBU1060810.1 hypothetical protein [Pseudomonadota bacterium]